MAGIPKPRFIIQERRKEVLMMLSKGLSEVEIANVLNVNQSTVCRDVKVIKKESQKVTNSILTEIMPYEHAKCIASMNHLMKGCWKIIDSKDGKWSNKSKIDAMKLLKELIRTSEFLSVRT